ncbi:MAG: ATP-binding protein [Gammaproteobacteria bacterium]
MGELPLWRRLCRSMQFRILLAGASVMVIFVVAAVVILVEVFAVTIEQGVRDRLEASLYGVMAVAEVLNEDLWLPETLPEERFNQLTSGQYAWVSAAGARLVWRSHSTVGKGQLPNPAALSVGGFAWRTEYLGGEPVWVLSFASSWSLESGEQRAYQFSLAQHQAPFTAQIRQFQFLLVFSFVSLGVLLCVIQVLLLRRGLRPLGRLAQKIRDIESGETSHIEGRFPFELDPVVQNINAMVEHERAQRERYRDTLSDLAHSLKTPLTVLRGVWCGVEERDQAWRDDSAGTVNEQIDRMDKIIQYHLKRSVLHQNARVLQRTELAPLLIKILEALQRVYSAKSMQVDLQMADALRHATVRMEEADVFEVFGNVLENAFKYGHQRIQVRVSDVENGNALRVMIADDGAGIPESDRERVLARGARLDETVASGQGIGLAVVADICRVYGVGLKVGSSHTLRGAELTFILPKK